MTTKEYVALFLAAIFIVLVSGAVWASCVYGPCRDDDVSGMQRPTCTNRHHRMIFLQGRTVCTCVAPAGSAP